VQCEGHRYDTVMAIYTVHLPPDGDADKARFLREGGNILALIVPAIWLIWQRLWLWLLLYIALSIAIGLAGRLAGSGALFLGILPGLYLFLEGNELVRARLERVGWNLAGVVEASNRADAELRFFDAERNQENERRSNGGQAANVVSVPRTLPQQGIGLFPE
jgi:Protein of unknown function (DUF2628)